MNSTYLSQLIIAAVLDPTLHAVLVHALSLTNSRCPWLSKQWIERVEHLGALLCLPEVEIGAAMETGFKMAKQWTLLSKKLWCLAYFRETVLSYLVFLACFWQHRLCDNCQWAAWNQTWISGSWQYETVEIIIFIYQSNNKNMNYPSSLVLKHWFFLSENSHKESTESHFLSNQV